MARWDDEPTPNDEQRTYSAQALADAIRGAARGAARMVSPAAGSPGAMAVAGVRSVLPGGGSFSEEMQRYNDAADPGLWTKPSVIPELAAEQRGEVAQNLAIALQPAYHGTPHAWEGPGAPLEAARGKTFDLSKIGTGEGAQAYGWGAYATKEPKVAEQYRDVLTNHQNQIVTLKPGVTWEALRKDAIDKLNASADEYEGTHQAYGKARRARDVADAIASMEEAKSGGVGYLRDLFDNYSHAKFSLDDLLDIKDNPGRLYKLDAPEDAEMLHFDKPLREQPPGVLEALREADLLPTVKSGGDFPIRPGENVARVGDWYMAPKDKALMVRGSPVNRVTSDFDPASTLGRDLYHYLDRYVADGGARGASEALRAAGIPGHLYTGDSSGVQNMVIYDPARAPVVDAYTSLADMKSRSERLAEAMRNRGTDAP